MGKKLKYIGMELMKLMMMKEFEVLILRVKFKGSLVKYEKEEMIYVIIKKRMGMVI